ncbi:phage tail tape measure protein [Sediminibacillus halophilus]|uniref:Phage tail tape measure protein, TP901 family, core region n=1 Tax=Sediminibacillus halophilus TaxID=482461 RepID=A0A1G9QVI8_9BACI|nr:phage tail tape measure protein [Sediminibacillus halophilus]SDM14627.1 phage tail tape measure protein, TP901 family, core region [Sediminibacillus halophilus]
MERIEGMSIGLDLETMKVESGLTDLRSKMRLVNSEMKANLSAFDRGDRSIRKYETRLEGLNKKLEVQRSITEKAKRNYEKMVNEHGEGSIEAEKAAKAYNNQSASLQNLERYVDRTTEELKELKREQEISESRWGKMSTSMQKAGDKFMSVGKSMTGIGKNLTMSVTAPIAGLGGLMLKTGMDFEKSMSNVQAISGATGNDLEQLEGKARELGASTSKSASEAADALGYMALAGWDTTQMMDGLEPVLRLSEAGNIDLARASDLATDSMSALGVEVEDLPKYLDNVAQAARNSNTDIDALMEAYITAGGNFKEFNVPLEESTALLGTLANRGFKGSEAGRAMNAIMVNLSSGAGQAGKAMEDLEISAFDADGQFIGLEETLRLVKDRTKDMTDEQRAQYISMIAGKEHLKTFQGLLSGLDDEYGELKGDVSDADGALNDMAETMQDNAQGNIQRLKSAFEELSIQFSDKVLPMFTDGVEKVTDLVQWFGELDESTQKQILIMGGLAAAMGPVLMVGGSLVSTIGGIVTIAGAASGAIAGAGGLGAALAGFATGPVGIAIGALAGLTAGGIALYNHLKQDAIPEVELFGDQVSDSTEKAVGSFMDLNEEATVQLDELAWSGKEVTSDMRDSLVSNFDQMGNMIIDGLEEDKNDTLSVMKDLFSDAKNISEEEQSEIIKNVTEGYEERKNITKEGMNRINEIYSNALEENRTTTEKENAEVARIQQEWLDMGIEVLTENQQEQKVILENMQRQSSEISARQAAEVVKNSIEQKDKVIAEAEEQYNRAVAEFTRQRDDSGELTKEQADTLIAEAERQKNDTISHAEEMHSRVVEEAQAQAQEHVDNVSWETGEIYSKWDKLQIDLGAKYLTMYADLSKFTKDSQSNIGDFVVNSTGKFLDFKSSATDSIADLVSNGLIKFEELKVGTGAALKATKDIMSDRFEDMVDKAKGLPKMLGAGIGYMAGDVKDGITDVINAMASKLGKGINGTIGGVNWVLGKIGVDKSIPKWDVPHYAEGTEGHPGGLAIVGDGKGINAGPELIQSPDGKLGLSPDKPTLVNMEKGTSVLSAKETRPLLDLIPKYAFGIGSLKEAAGKVKDTALNVWDYISNPSKLFDKAMEKFGVVTPDLPGLFDGLGKGLFNKVKDELRDYIKNKISDFGSFDTNAPGNVKSWIAAAMSRTGVPSSWLGPLTTIAMKESGGRTGPSTINRWDINAKRGTPSMGLMQTIGPTFNAFKAPGWNDIMNPIHNAAAAINYIKSRYGSAFNVPGIKALAKGLPYVGYKTGARISTPGLYGFAEDGWPEYAISTNPARRTDSMKLLALAGKEIAGNKRPGQLPDYQETNSRVVQILEQLLEVLTNGGGRNEINQTVNYYDTVPNPSETARKNKRALQQLGLELN